MKGDLSNQDHGQLKLLSYLLDVYNLQILNLQASLNGGDFPPFSVHLLPFLANFLLCVAIITNAFETPGLGSSLEPGAQKASHECVTETGQLRRTHPAEVTGWSLLLIEVSLLPFWQRPGLGVWGCIWGKCL